MDYLVKTVSTTIRDSYSKAFSDFVIKSGIEDFAVLKTNSSIVVLQFYSQKDYDRYLNQNLENKFKSIFMV